MKKIPKSKPAAAVAVVEGTEISVPLNRLQPSRFQKRTFDKDAEVKLNELAEDLRKNGMLQKPMVIKGSKPGFYELVFGDRRRRAAGIIGLKDITVIEVDWSPERIRDAHFSENAKRADLHPLDRAAELHDWKHSTVPEMTTRELALKAGMSERETAKALALMDLIEPAQKLFREGKIEHGHAHQLARLSPEVQPQALDQCFEQEHTGWDQKTGTHRYKIHYDRAVSVTQLSKWIDKNLIQELSRAPWKLDDETLVPSQGPCSNCQFNTSANAMLFGDAPPKTAICTNAEGFQRKMRAWIDRLIEENTVDGQPPLVVSMNYSFHNIGRNIKTWYHQTLGEKVGGKVLLNSEYNKAGGKDKCGYERPAIIVDGKEPGTMMKACVEPRCPSHAGRKVSSSTSRGKGAIKSPAERDAFNDRKQELFDLRAAEKARKRIFVSVAAHMNDKLDRAWRERIAAEFFLRCPDFDQTTIQEVMIDVATENKSDVAVVSDLPTLHYDYDKLLARLKKFSDRQLGQLIQLCSFGHYGANQYMQKPVNQHQVIALAKERGVDYPLADAVARVELSSKKYMQAHLDHLEAIQGGKKSRIPHVYDPVEPETSAKGSKRPGKAKGAQKRAKKR